MIFQSRYFLELEYFIYLRSFFSFICFFCYDVLVLTSKDMWFIVIEKQEDLPTDLEIKSIVGGNLEELILDNGDILICNKEPTNYPINWKTTEMWKTGRVVALTGQRETILGHCYLIKKNVKY